MSDTDFIKTILRYHTSHGRHTLPWRKSISPYKVLVSELMLQQTQVNRVIPKFNLWIKQYPTMTSLKQASLSDILRMWQGLGYQRRAKALYEIAQKVKTLPKTYEGLCDLPGVGPYTASAICAFAYNGFSYPVLETNIRTALIEYFHMNKKTVDDETLYADLERLEKSMTVKKIGARVWYGALMDYGAYLKSVRISHNHKVKGHTKQKPYKGSLRELRAKALFAITHKETLPNDKRITSVFEALMKEGFIKYSKGKYSIT
jgi:A/G-specific adenine glycosylase